MSRKSARFIAQELLNFSTSDVYECWKDMGIVVKDKFGDWVLTEYGRSIGGRMSQGNHLPVPIFDADKVIDMMIAFCKEKFK